jgi:lysyl-tRNA synthetase class 2
MANDELNQVNDELNQADIEKLEEEYNELMKQRMIKLQDLKDKGQDPFEIVRYDRTHNSQEVKDKYEELEGTDVKVAGRLMSKRVHGKAGFSDIHDRDGKLQLYVRIDDVGEEKLKFFKTLDLGDIIGVEGTVFKTKTGEVSIHVKDFTLLTKSLRPLPEKWHGLKDPDLRYRQRYVDLIVNPEVKDTFLKRTQIIRLIRKFLDERGYIEVETPILSTIASGAAARRRACPLRRSDGRTASREIPDGRTAGCRAWRWCTPRTGRFAGREPVSSSGVFHHK